MARAKKAKDDINKIKDDIDSLKENTIKLGKHVKQEGVIRTEEAKETIVDNVHMLTDASKEQLQRVETKVKEKPLQSMAVAFAAGLALSVLLGRRR